MSNMKNLLSGITFEDVDLVQSMITDDITNEEIGNIFMVWEKYGETTYQHWLETYGRELSIKWIVEHNELPITDEWIIKYRAYVSNKFIDWVKGNL